MLMILCAKNEQRLLQRIASERYLTRGVFFGVREQKTRKLRSVELHRNYQAHLSSQIVLPIQLKLSHMMSCFFQYQS